MYMKYISHTNNNIIKIFHIKIVFNHSFNEINHFILFENNLNIYNNHINKIINKNIK